MVLALREPTAELLETWTRENKRNYFALVQATWLIFGNENIQQVYRIQLQNRNLESGETLQQLQADMQRQ